MKECKHCGSQFDETSQFKREVGGYINECPPCVEELGSETAVKHAGVMAGDGKGIGVTVLSFQDEASRSSYVRAWRACSGQNTGKGCQLGRGQMAMSSLQFKKVGESGSIGTNHKGKL